MAEQYDLTVPHAWKEAHSHGNLWHLKDNHSQTKIAQKGYLGCL